MTILFRTILFAALTMVYAAAQTPQNGMAAGTVIDAQSGRPLSGVIVTAEGGNAPEGYTDSDGKFRLSLRPGTYNLKFSATAYADATIADVEIRPAQTTQASTVMVLQTVVTSVDVVEKATAVEATAEALLTERKLASTISDGISRQELAGSVASDAARALETVTGVSIVEDGYVYVRGLGERYSATMLNGALLPTTEPEKRVVPLDLFPAGMIENIRILKTYTPDLPAEFAGGLVQMSTIEFPTQKTLQVSVKSGMNTRTTTSPFLTYPGGSRDFLGFDDGSRGIPSGVPEAAVFPGAFSPQQLQTIGRAFSNNWESTRQGNARVPLDFKAVGGGAFGRFGLVGAISFSNAPQTQKEVQRYLRQGVGSPVVFTEYPEFSEYTERARLGAVFNVAVRLTQNHKIVFRNLLTRDAEKSSREFSGYDGGVDSSIQSQRLRWVDRTLLANSVEGDHTFVNLHNSLIRWQFTYARSERNEPDLREVFRGLLPNGSYIFSAFGSSGIRFFSNLADRIYEPQADYSVPFFKGRVTGVFKTGVRASFRHRDFSARRFRYIPQQSSTLNLFLPSNQLFAATNIRPDGFQIVEFTRGTDTYTGDMNILAGYAMVDLALGGRWRLVGGLRYEHADIGVTTVDNRIPNAVPQTASLINTDPTPGVNVIYALTGRQNLRFGFSRTLSRPDFRELSPFDFANVLGGFVVQGNPLLNRATINNYDARWERFLGGNQVIAASFFAKTFQNPIEQTILPSNDLRQTFVNAKGARNLGVEFEFRKALGSISKKLQPFAVSANVTIVSSNIEIRPENAGVVTSLSRPLLGQSRYIWNAQAEWVKPAWRSRARFYANQVSRRVSSVGTFQLPDIYQEGNLFLDFVYEYSPSENSRWQLRMDAQNLGDTKYRWTQGSFDQRAYQLGRTFQVGLTYRIF
ncbi:MAG: TonB-dependent receptor [Bryobacteraceae bacterium]